MRYKLLDLIKKFGGELIGDDIEFSAIAPIEQAKTTELTFLVEPKYLKKLPNCQASAIIVKAEHVDKVREQNNKLNMVVVDDPYLYFCHVSQLLYQPRRLAPGIKPTANVAVAAKIGANAAIADFVAIGENVIIGDNCQIYPQVTIGDNTVIGDNVVIYANVAIYNNITIGNNCVFHSGAVIGADGFGYAMDKEHKWHKIPQIGGVKIGNNVEIGANTTIDSGTFTPTILEDGVKIDNLVQIAHNVKIGANTAIAACVGISGSVTIGKCCRIAGGAGISGHLSIADYTVIGGLSGVAKTIDTPGYYAGVFPLMEFKNWAKNAVHIRRLNEMYQSIKKLEKLIQQEDDKNGAAANT